MEEFGKTMKASGGKSGGTSPEEKTGVIPRVAKLPISPNGGRGELRALGGGKHDEGNQRLTALPPLDAHGAPRGRQRR
jgi:hypothetical protein